MGQLELFGDRPTLRQLWDEAPAELNSTVAPQDVPRLRASLRQLYELMSDGGWYTASEIEIMAGRRYGARLCELAKAGIPHEAERLRGGEWKYRLIASCTNGITGPG